VAAQKKKTKKLTSYHRQETFVLRPNSQRNSNPKIASFFFVSSSPVLVGMHVIIQVTRTPLSRSHLCLPVRTHVSSPCT